MADAQICYHGRQVSICAVCAPAADAAYKAAPPSLEDGPGPWGTEIYCGRCGGSTEFVRCPDCDGGWSDHDCGEDCCACVDPEPNVLCLTCGGAGGSRHCTNSPEWCEANPLPGRESVPSSALSNRAWSDL